LDGWGKKNGLWGALSAHLKHKYKKMNMVRPKMLDGGGGLGESRSNHSLMNIASIAETRANAPQSLGGHAEVLSKIPLASTPLILFGYRREESSLTGISISYCLAWHRGGYRSRASRR